MNQAKSFVLVVAIAFAFLCAHCCFCSCCLWCFTPTLSLSLLPLFFLFTTLVLSFICSFLCSFNRVSVSDSLCYYPSPCSCSGLIACFALLNNVIDLFLFSFLFCVYKNSLLIRSIHFYTSSSHLHIKHTLNNINSHFTWLASSFSFLICFSFNFIICSFFLINAFIFFSYSTVY